MSKKSFNRKSFIVWLRSQKDRNDQTGMFARKLLAIPIACHLKTITGVRYLVSLEDDPDLSSEILEQAYSEFKGQLK